MTVVQSSNLARYVPIHVLRQVAIDPTPISKPTIERFSAAVLFADITGFSSMTERLAARGPDGAEQISRHLNSYMGRIIDMVLEQGGDVVKFAGDALIAVYPSRSDALSNPVRLATQASLKIQEELGSYDDADGIVFSLRICVGAGPVALMHLGGVLKRWESLISGAPFAQIRSLRPHTEPTEVLLSAEAWDSTRGLLEGEERPGGARRVTRIIERLTPTANEAPAIDPRSEPALRALIPGVVLSRLAAGQSDWLGELRRISVGFIGLPAVEEDDPNPLEKMQKVVSAIQDAVYRYDGSINKIAVDEKGAVLVTAFGLPPLSHEDDPNRAVKAALAMQEKLASVGLQGSLGVSTGRVFCGSVGNEHRGEYTMIGNPVNLAARLMTAAEGRILCDDNTRKVAEKELIFEHLKRIPLKGFAEPVRVARPTGETKLTLRSKIALVGRGREQALLSECIQGLVRTRQAGTVVIVGEAGIGKSRLVDEVVHLAKTHGVTTFVGAGDSVEDKTPYFAWRPIFSRVLKVQDCSEAVDLAATISGLLQDHPELLKLVPLLNVVLPLDMADNEHTIQMTGETRANNTHNLLVRLLARAARQEPALLVIEDAHWIDSASWAMVKQVTQGVPEVMVLLVTRPIQDPAPAEYVEILGLDEVEKITLGGLNREETATLIRQRLGVVRLPDEVTEVIYERAEGNPLFTEELAYVIRDNGQILIDGEDCRLSMRVDEFAQTSLPDTVESVVTSRVDRLDMQQQMVLKVASVIGRSFPVNIVRDIFPLEDQRERVAEMMEPLVQLDVIHPEDNDEHPSYIFKHVLMQEAIYNLMLYSQRRDLHRAVAEWHEEHGLSGERSKNFELLAHHWEAAEEWPRAVEYLERAGAQALESFANEECVAFHNRAITLDRKHDVGTTEERKGRWQRHMAEAQFRLGNISGAVQHGRVALLAMGRPLPRSKVGTVFSLLGQVFLRVIQAGLPSLFKIKEEAERELRIAATRLQNRMTEAFIYQEDALRCLDSGLREINTSEPAGQSPELGRAYAVLTVVLGTVPVHRICRSWQRRALKAAEYTDNPSALAYVLSRAAVYDLYLGHWELGIERQQQALELARSVGDRRLSEDAMAILGKMLFYCGRFQESRRMWEETDTSTRYSGNEQTQAWSLFGRAENLMRMGSAAAALPLLEETVSYVSAKATASDELWMYGLYALAHYRVGDLDKARAVADRTLPLAVARPVAYWTQQSAAAVAETYLFLWAEGHGDLQKLAGKAVKGCESFARIFPFGRPQALLWRGMYHKVAGKQDRAAATWERCIEVAERLGTPYERGRAHLELGLSLGPDEPARRHHLKRAVTILEPLGTMWEIGRARKALQGAR